MSLAPGRGEGGAGASYWSALLWEKGQRAILKEILTRVLLHIRIRGGEWGQPASFLFDGHSL